MSLSSLQLPGGVAEHQGHESWALMPDIQVMHAARRVTGDAESHLQVVRALVSSAAADAVLNLPRCRRTLGTVASRMEQLQIQGLCFSPGLWIKW